MGIQVNIEQGEYRSGDDLVFEFTVDDADSPTPQVKDLTGATITWVLCSKQGAVPIVTKSAISTEILVPTPASGVLQVIILPADTDGLTGQHWHELEIVDSAGRRHTSAYGNFYIEPDSANQP